VRIDYPRELTMCATDLFDFIIDVGRRNPKANHIGFAFSYDSNMLVQTLSEKVLVRLHRLGNASLRYDDGRRYYLEFRPGKWFRVVKWIGEKKVGSVCIEDIFSYFATSFLAAYEALCGTAPEIVVAGKGKRKEFSMDDFDDIERYWEVEIGMLRELAEALRSNLYSAGLTVSHWYGPGALASFVLKREGIRSHMSESPLHIYQAARYAYAGGRFEVFRVGREARPTYAADINSAYPYAISQLPSLASGKWIPTSTPPNARTCFGVYHVRIHPMASGSIFTDPGPLFHRDKNGLISYPWALEGWYWAPEVWEAYSRHPECVEIVEGWEWISDSDIRPFSWITDMYQQRLEWKAMGISSQLALKLCMNSLYGKMAQRVGWNIETQRAPIWHQLEWAGWVTSLTRANLFSALSQLQSGTLISVETDAIYTTDPLVKDIVTVGNGLGEWGLDVYDEVIYLQSGLAWLRQGDKWTDKRRGLDRDSFTLESCQAYVETLKPNIEWESYHGVTTRFIGLGSAIASSLPTKLRHCVWHTGSREINIGRNGKRKHMRGMCDSCRANRIASEEMHTLCVATNAYDPRQRMSTPHDIPWDTGQTFEWRDDFGEGITHYG